MRLIAAGVLTTLALHFAWEMLQAPAFVDFAGSTWAGTVRCFIAALGDVLLASGAYVVTTLLFRRAAWPVQRSWLSPAVTWVAAGVLATVAFERLALARGQWSYGPEMPRIAGVGLFPLLQWLIVPALTLTIMRYVVASRRLHPS
jgi:hypothetical protein